MFGEKSERRLVDIPAEQGQLFADAVASPEQSTEDKAFPVAAYQRRKKHRPEDAVLDKGLRFTEAVPVEMLEITPTELQGKSATAYVVLGYESTFRLAQRPGSYVILEYRSPKYKKKGTDLIQQPPAPPNVLEGSCVDVSLLAGLLVDKFAYHLPLYRQHQRLNDAGITVARSSLLNWCSRAINLLSPIVAAQHRSVLNSHVLGMDETPIKAGKAKAKGKMKKGYLWPMYGDQDEVVFHYSPSRGAKVVQEQLADQFEGVLLCDGYQAYQAYAENKDKVVLANCWSHTRRYFEKAKTIDPQASSEALVLIGKLYQQETLLRDKKLDGQQTLSHRLKYSEPIVKQFWQWCYQQKQRTDLFPKHPLMTALNYALSRVEPLQVFLSDPDVPLDTNHVERSLRPIPMGRKNWLFCWTEMGAEHVAIIQSLIVTCRLQGVNPYQYLLDVLQRIAVHPNSRIEELTPRNWKRLFANNPMGSHLDMKV